MTTGTFTPAECGNGGPMAGVLDEPRRDEAVLLELRVPPRALGAGGVRLHEVPGRVSASADQDVGGAAPYTGVWPFNSIASPTNGGGRVNFQDTSAVICANCHTTINHIAPLFAYYDMNGQYQTQIAVPTPLDGAPPAQMSDYLPARRDHRVALRRPGGRHPGARRRHGRRPRGRRVRRRPHLELGARQDGHRRHAQDGPARHDRQSGPGLHGRTASS